MLLRVEWLLGLGTFWWWTLRFLGSKVRDDPQEFFDEVYKIVNYMGVTSTEKVELAAYQLKYVA